MRRKGRTPTKFGNEWTPTGPTTQYVPHGEITMTWFTVKSRPIAALVDKP